MKKRVAYILLIIVSVFIQPIAHAQDNLVWERVYIATDKHTYISGDKVWCSAYCFTKGEQVSISDFSSTVYLELQTNEQVVLTAKIALIDGRGAGAIELPPTLPTGNYKLVAYTKQNRNEMGFAPYEKIISVFNVLTTERLGNDVVIVGDSEVEKVEATPAKYGKLDVKLPERTLRQGEEFYFTLDNRFDDAVSLNVSIYNKDPYLERDNYGIVTFRSSISNTPKGKITNSFIPDYEGEVVELSTQGARGKSMHITFFGSEQNYFAPAVGENGKVIIVTPNIYGDNDLFYEGATSAVIKDPFIKRVSANIPKLRLSPSIEKELLDRGFSMQVGKRFDADTLYEKLPVRPSIFFDEGKVVYHLDDYTRFPTMQEVIVEFVTELKIRNDKKSRYLSVIMDTPGAIVSNPQFGAGLALILLDGVPVTDHEKIINYDPLLVKTIEIYTDAFSVGSRLYDGVANFITYKRDIAGFDFGRDLKILPFKGALLPMSFTGESIQVGGRYPDYRQTIYWHPILDIAPGEKREIRCIAPLYNGDFQVVVEGVTSAGEVIFYRSDLNMQHTNQPLAIDDAKLMEQIQLTKSSEPVSKPMNKTLKEETVAPVAVPVVAPVVLPVVTPPAEPETKAITTAVSKPVSEPVSKPASSVVSKTVSVPVTVPVPASALTVKQENQSEKKNLESFPIKKVREGELKKGVKYKSSIEIR